MQHFVRCTNCRQWYVRSFTRAVQISRGNHLHRITEWCLHCIGAAEQRSQAVDQHVPELSETDLTHVNAHEQSMTHTSLSDAFQDYLQEHTQLMDRALHEDDAVLIPLVENFMQRCRTYHEQLADSALAQRLVRHIQYWETFLKALRQS